MSARLHIPICNCRQVVCVGSRATPLQIRKMLLFLAPSKCRHSRSIVTVCCPLSLPDVAKEEQSATDAQEECVDHFEGAYDGFEQHLNLTQQLPYNPGKRSGGLDCSVHAAYFAALDTVICR